MLKYEFKLHGDSIKKEEIVWKEKYLSKDLSYVTGVTNTNQHLEKFTKLAATNRINNMESILNIECENVKRQGFIIVKEKEYDTFSASVIDYSVEKSGETLNYQYTENKGKYFYWGKFANENKSGYTFNNLLNYDRENDEVIETINVVCNNKEETPIKIDTVYWIEDGIVEIDGNKYFYDKNEGENNGVLKYGENGDALKPEEITRCSGIEFHPSSKNEEVTKFRLTKEDKREEKFSEITFAKYYYYVNYKNHYCPIRQKFTENNYEFVCDVPLYVISGTNENRLDDIETKEYPLYFADESTPYEDCCDDEHLINKKNLDKHGVYNLNDLKNAISFIYINDAEEACFGVNHEVINGNDGNEIIVYLENPYSPLSEGDKILFASTVDTEYVEPLYNSKDYGVEIDENYVIINSKKYLVEDNILDKVIINGEEYDIDYSLNGKVKDKNCLVSINGEKVPMLISSIDGGETYSAGTLQRYGKIVISSSTFATDVTYEIKPYSGITVNGNKYIIRESKSTDDLQPYKYAEIKQQKMYTFSVIDKIGNSMYVCEPTLNTTEFTEEFIKFISNDICSYVVSNQNDFLAYVDNKIFGEKEITKDLAFIRTTSPTSSDDYYNLFDDLTLFNKNSYIILPISLNTKIGNNILQEDIVKKEFYEVEKNKAINPIVDMEKDVYLPKYISGYYDGNNAYEYPSTADHMYSGSSTIFKSIYEINFNLHFRTRDLDNWKINDGYNLYDTSGSCDNWFITDMHPYCDLLNNAENRTESGKTLMEASDLIGLLNFSDNDVFYQKSKIMKSFLRLSFYDNTDPQTQSLLATSCIFMDGHGLFKKFTNNSQMNENIYASTSLPIFQRIDGYITSAKTDIASNDIRKEKRINVNTEYLAPAACADTRYYSYEYDCVNVNIGDESHRMSSRLTVRNKYVSDKSSEGFYLYMFREYSENLHPKPIYMKVEFNHAGIGKTIPFLIPMKWDTIEGHDDNTVFPIEKWTFENMTDEDLNTFKRGYPLSYVYAQTYIPLYAVYDFNNKEYCYVFDDRYIDANDGSLNINLFEMKIANESNNDYRKAVINTNTKQFDNKAFNQEV